MIATFVCEMPIYFKAALYSLDEPYKDASYLVVQSLDGHEFEDYNPRSMAVRVDEAGIVLDQSRGLWPDWRSMEVVSHADILAELGYSIA